MGKSEIISIIVSVALIISGVAIVLCTLFAVGFDHSLLNFNLLNRSSVSYDTKTYDITDSFVNIQIEESSADIIFAMSDDNNTHISCFDMEEVTHDVEVIGDMLNISRNPVNIVDSFTISLSSPNTNLTVYLPEKYYKSLKINGASCDVTISSQFQFDDLSIHTASGDLTLNSKVNNSADVSTASGEITIDSECVNKLSISTSSGDAYVNNIKDADEVNIKSASSDISIIEVTAKNIKCSTASGEITLKNTVAKNKIDISTTSGDITLNSSDSPELSFDSASGDVYCELLSKKIFETDTASGDVYISQEAYGENGKCKAHTASGDITFKIIE